MCIDICAYCTKRYEMIQEWAVPLEFKNAVQPIDKCWTITKMALSNCRWYMYYNVIYADKTHQWLTDLLVAQLEVTVQISCSYLVCATPRSGSTLLCEALSNTGLAGRPEEYFETLKVSGLPRRPHEYFTDLEDSNLAEVLQDYTQTDKPPPGSIRPA